MNTAHTHTPVFSLWHLRSRSVGPASSPFCMRLYFNTSEQSKGHQGGQRNDEKERIITLKCYTLCRGKHSIHSIQASWPDWRRSERWSDRPAESTAWGAKLEESKIGQSEEEKWKDRTTQACVCVTESPWTCFWMGFLFKFGHHSFHYHYYLYSLVDFVFSFIFLFRYVIPTRRLFTFFFSEGKACRKAWCCTWKRDFWQSHTPTSRKVLAHSWIFFCCSGTYGYVIPGVKRGLQDMCIMVFCVSPVLTEIRVLIFLPFSFPLALAPCNKSHIVAVFISAPSGVCLRLDSKPGTARLLPFWSPFL